MIYINMAAGLIFFVDFYSTKSFFPVHCLSWLRSCLISGPVSSVWLEERSFLDFKGVITEAASPCCASSSDCSSSSFSHLDMLEMVGSSSSSSSKSSGESARSAAELCV